MLIFCCLLTVKVGLNCQAGYATVPSELLKLKLFFGQYKLIYYKHTAGSMLPLFFLSRNEWFKFSLTVS